jgi:hypothetical protein
MILKKATTLGESVVAASSDIGFIALNKIR